MQVILWIAVLVAVIVFPVMLSARVLGAARTSFGAALLAVIAQIILSALTRYFDSSHLIMFCIMAIGGSVIYAYFLSTTLLRGFFISILATVISGVAIVLLAGMFSGIRAAI